MSFPKWAGSQGRMRWHLTESKSTISSFGHMHGQILQQLEVPASKPSPLIRSKRREKGIACWLIDRGVFPG